MAKSFVVLAFLAVAGAGVYFVVSGSGSDVNNAGSVVSSLAATKAQEKLVADARKSQLKVSDIPVPSKTGPWPKAVAKDPTFSFGRMQVRENNSHEFKIHNEGEADLILRTGSTTCKCTKFGFGVVASTHEEESGDKKETEAAKSAVVNPGESVILTMSWKGGEVADRGFRHGGDVFTNDPNNSTLKFAVEGAIEMPFDLQPGVWSVGNVYARQPGKMRATLGTKIFEQLDIESITSPSGLVTVTPLPLTAEDRALNTFVSGHSLEVIVSENIPAGVFAEEIQIKVAQLKEPIRVTVSAKKQGVLRLQPMAGTWFDPDRMQLKLGSFPASEGRSATMLLIVDEKEMSEPFQITEVKSDPSFVTAAIEPIGQPSGTVHRYVLTIAVPPGKPHVQKVESAPGTLKLSTNHPSGEGIHFDLLLYSN